MIETTGNVKGTLDLQSGDGSASVHATSTPKSCRVMSSIFGMNVTIDGAPNVMLVGSLEMRSFSVIFLEADMDGRVAWKAEDGRSDICDIDAHLSWNPDDGKSLSGTVCDEDISDL